MVLCLIVLAVSSDAVGQYNRRTEEKVTSYFEITFSLQSGQEFSISELPVELGQSSPVKVRATDAFQAEAYFRSGFFYLGAWFRHYGTSEIRIADDNTGWWQRTQIQKTRIGPSIMVSTEYFTPLENYDLLWVKVRMGIQADIIGRGLEHEKGTSTIGSTETYKLGRLYEQRFVVDVFMTLKNLRKLQFGVFSLGFQVGYSVYGRNEADGMERVQFEPEDTFSYAFTVSLSL